MALGEYVSVSTQRDTQRALLQKERQELDEMPEAELEELAGLYAAKGLSPETARVGNALARSPLNRPELEIVLMEPKAGGLHDAETIAQLRSLVSKGKLGAGVFEVDDCRRTYEELKAKGVEFLAPPVLCKTAEAEVATART